MSQDLKGFAESRGVSYPAGARRCLQKRSPESWDAPVLIVRSPLSVAARLVGCRPPPTLLVR